MKPDLDAIRARWPDGRLANTDARTDVLTLLAYIDKLERDLLNERAAFESCNRARRHCEDECAALKKRTYTVGGTEWAQRIATLEHMLAEERDNVDTLRAAVEHAEQRFVDEYDAHKEAKRDRDELREELFDWQHAVEYVLGDNWSSADGHDAKAARKALAEWAEQAQGEAPQLLAEIAELKARIVTLEAMKP